MEGVDADAMPAGVGTGKPMAANNSFCAAPISVKPVSPLSTPRVVPGDVDDDHVIAAAVAGSAEIVVSGIGIC